MALTRMAELEIDQSHLPRVQEVRQNFAVLEDGVFAHSLQEQEIEQYYMTNIQKNQLVQNDIRVAKQLQDEEEEQRAQHSALLRQTSRQIEEQDFEYARLIQEQIQRRAEEARRREMDDEEFAKRMQEEEEQRLRRAREASSSGSEPSPSHHAHSSPQYSPSSSRGQRSTYHYSSHYNSPQAGSPRGLRTNPHLRSSEGHPFRDSGQRFSDESEGSDTVFSEHSSVRAKTLPPQRQMRDRNDRSVVSHRSFPEPCNDYERRNHHEKAYAERWRAQNHHNLESELRREYDRKQELESESAEVRQRCKRTDSVRLPDKRRQSFREAAKTWAYRDNPDKHVRFRDDSTKSDGRMEVWEMLGQVLRERGVPVRLGNSSGAPLQIGAAQRRERRDSRALYGSEASCSDTQPHQRAFQRAVTARHSFHGDIRERRRKSCNREQTQGQDYEPVQPDREIRRRDSNLSRERQGSRRWKEHKCVRKDESGANEHRITRTTSERRSSEEWDMERPDRRAPNRSQSLSSSSSSSRALRSRHTPTTERDRTSLELGELQQVLHDEELARTLQEEEGRVQSREAEPSLGNSYPEGDFQVAQVAQDEEIARFMQKQEIKSKRRSRELEGPVSWREHRTMMSQHDRRVRDRQVPRERLDSEGLPSPPEDCSPEDQPHSAVSTLPTSSEIRNIAEELDPTFQVRRSGPESLQEAHTGGSCCAPLPAQSAFLEEPTFIPPTKRQAEKSVRPKSKEKRENCKQQ
ncbi:coiled-coil domain-containing protein 187 isoform X1 [Eucyclogobius newberryi]|uniref:coiled-coil domain-containing protein 187 isoform X1 n=1 Tax=Eucyclogobius newberryi TaxID=166745 RepID=UPI003B5BC3FB